LDDDVYCRSCGAKISSGKPAPSPFDPSVLCYDETEVSTSFLIGEAIRSFIKPSRVKLNPSCAVYANRPQGSMVSYLINAVILTIFGLFISYGSSWFRFICFTISSYAAPVIYLIWMMRNDRYEREPIPLVAYVFGWGALAGIIASFINSLIAVPLLGAPGAAFVEEPLKILGVYLLIRRGRVGTEFNDHMDGMVYGAAAGAGFAGLENLFYTFLIVRNEGLPLAAAFIIRSATAFGHIAWSAMAGRSLGLAKALRGRVVVTDMIPGLLIAIGMHFLWNLLPISFMFILPVSIIVLTRLIRAAVRDETEWGFETSAPVENN
jgi:RsiW-degrading membrane proteinase PrsW (M82 family)